MKIKIKNPQEYLLFLDKIADSKLPQYENILISAEDEKVYLKASSGNVTCSISIPGCEIIERGKVCLNSKRLSSLIDNDVLISGNNEKVDVKIGKGNYKISAIPYDNFPKIPEASADGIKLHYRDLLRIVNYSVFYDKNDTTGPFSALKVSIKDGDCSTISTDKTRFSLYSTKIEGTYEFLIPCQILPILKSFIHISEDFIHISEDDPVLNLQYIPQVEVSHYQGILYFKTSLGTLTSTTLAATFPDISKVLIQESEIKHLITINTREFIDSLHRILTTADRVSGEIIISIKGNQLIISTKTVQTDGTEEITVEPNKLSEVSLNFNGFTLLKFAEKMRQEFLLIINDKENKIQFKSRDISYVTTCLTKRNVEVGK